MSSEAKAKGAAAYKASQWAEAVAGFTEAIDAEDVDVDEIHKLYSNRCAAYMQVKHRCCSHRARAATALPPPLPLLPASPA